IFTWNSLPESLKSILPQYYTYLIKNFNEFSLFRTVENFEIPQFELHGFVDFDNKEKAHEWFLAFESHSKTTMPQTKGYTIKGKKVLFREKRHCIHSNEVKKKQGNRETKHPHSSRARNINCNASIHLRLEKWRLDLSHPLEINIKFIHNHIIDSAESLSFRHVKEEVRNKFLELFKDGHSPISALYSHEDNLYLLATNDQELLELLADRANNPDYNYIYKLFQQYRETTFGNYNGKGMFDHLTEMIDNYNNSGNGKAILQKYDTYTGEAFILCIVTGLMCRVHEKIPQTGELCYMDASASFEPLNTSITLLYTSCMIGALPLGLFITSDECEITLEKA
ncbi:5969_t:CDS:1, partial [Acaulospora morrowiae]